MYASPSATISDHLVQPVGEIKLSSCSVEQNAEEKSDQRRTPLFICLLWWNRDGALPPALKQIRSRPVLVGGPNSI